MHPGRTAQIWVETSFEWSENVTKWERFNFIVKRAYFDEGIEFLVCNFTSRDSSSLPSHGILSKGNELIRISELKNVGYWNHRSSCLFFIHYISQFVHIISVRSLFLRKFKWRIYVFFFTRKNYDDNDVVGVVRRGFLFALSTKLIKWC